MVKTSNNVLGVTAQTQFFHMFKVMFDSGDVTKMGSHAFTVYAYIKSCVNYDKGDAFPSVAKIVEKTGVSRASVFRSLTLLTEMGYITSTKKGRHNVYTLNEQIPLVNELGEVEATASWEYIPKVTAKAVQELKDVLTGTVLANETKFIQIDKLQVIVSNVEAGASQTVYNGDHLHNDSSFDLHSAIEKGVITEPSLLKILERKIQAKLKNADTDEERLALEQRLENFQSLIATLDD